MAMDAAKKSGNGLDPAMLQFITGGLRKELGLESIDLMAGLDIARNHLKRGATPEAMRIYATLVLCEPANIEFQAGLANCALVMGEYHLALQAASALIALAPTDPRGFFFSGRACMGLGHYPEAVEDLGDAVQLGRKAMNAAIVNEANGLLEKLAALSH